MGSGAWLWRESVGSKAVNRVTVGQRPDATSLYIEWWEGGKRVRRSLRRLVGAPVTDRSLALEIAQAVAEKQAVDGRASAQGVIRPARARKHEVEQLRALPVERLLANRLPAAPICGVYFLLRAGRIVYVGQSIDVMRRVSDHQKAPPCEFDGVAFQNVAQPDLARVEAFFIWRFDPEGNRTRPQLHEDDRGLDFLADLAAAGRGAA